MRRVTIKGPSHEILYEYCNISAAVVRRGNFARHTRQNGRASLVLSQPIKVQTEHASFIPPLLWRAHQVFGDDS